MEILITGGNGFLGRNLTSALLEDRHNVRVLALPTEDTAWLEAQQIKIFRGDLCDPEVLTSPMRGVDCVFHLAAALGAWGPMRQSYAVNVTGTQNVCRAARAAGVRRIVHVSSAMVYDLAAGRPATEGDPLCPIHEPYSLTKAAADRLVQRMIAEEHLPAVIIRPGTLFGPGDHLNFGRIADRLRARKSIVIGSGSNAVPFVYVTDVVRGLLLAMQSDRAVGQIYNIGSDELLSQKTLLGLIAHVIGVAPPRLHVPYHLLYAAAGAAEHLATLSNYRVRPFVTRQGVKLYGADNLLSIDKARRHLSYVPEVALRDGLQAAATWYLQNPSHSGPVSARIAA